MGFDETLFLNFKDTSLKNLAQNSFMGEFAFEITAEKHEERHIETTPKLLDQTEKSLFLQHLLNQISGNQLWPSLPDDHYKIKEIRVDFLTLHQISKDTADPHCVGRLTREHGNGEHH